MVGNRKSWEKFAYGKKTTYPYYFIVNDKQTAKKYNPIFLSGVFKTKKKTQEMAEEYCSRNKNYSYRIYDRRGK